MGLRFLSLCMAAATLAACIPDPNIYGPPAPILQGRPHHPPPMRAPGPPAAAYVQAGVPAAAFFNTLRQYCGQAFEGRVVSDDPEDAAMRRDRLILEVRNCNSREIRMPFAQGTNRSRTWVVARRGEGLLLKHDHRLKNGRPEPITLYGGHTVAPGTATRQEFPADDFSSELFFARNRPESAQNIWSLEVVPGRFIAYELRRSGRLLRVEFDLRRPLGPQPAPWG